MFSHKKVIIKRAAIATMTLAASASLVSPANAAPRPPDRPTSPQQQQLQRPWSTGWAACIGDNQLLLQFADDQSPSRLQLRGAVKTSDGTWFQTGFRLGSTIGLADVYITPDTVMGVFQVSDQDGLYSKVIFVDVDTNGECRVFATVDYGSRFDVIGNFFD